MGFTYLPSIIFPIALFCFSFVFKYYEDARRATPGTAEYKHAITFQVRFLFVGALFLGLFLGLIIVNIVA
jgi:hypothetical protein